MLVELKVIKTCGLVKTFTIDLPGLVANLDTPKSIKFEYCVASEECDSHANFDKIPASRMELATEPAINGWIQKIKTIGTAVKHDDMVSVYSDFKSEMSNKKYSDNMSILDPDDGTGTPPLRPTDEYKCIGNTRYCYHPDFLNRLFKLKSKQGTLTPTKALKVPKHVKNTYFGEIIKRSPPKNKVRANKRSPEHRSKDNSPKRQKVIEELFEQ